MKVISLNYIVESLKCQIIYISQGHLIIACTQRICPGHFQYKITAAEMKKLNKQCLLDTPRTVRVSEKT